MEITNNEMNQVLIESLKKTELVDLGEDLLEKGLDSLLKEGIVKEIPFVKFIIAMHETYITISDKILIKKLVLFLKKLNELPESTINKFISEINNNSKFKIKVGNKLLLLLDKNDDFEKSVMMAEVFKVYISKEIDYNTFQLLSHAINNTFIENIKVLKDVCEKLSSNYQINPEVLENLFQSGLLSLESHMILGGNGLVYKPNNLGSLLVKILYK